ncbi:MAG: tRNA (adenosine(37)-N6)-threonylcarbamoyltransferase complex ATPase subunit type 1 TsaE [Blastocatellia bacterium AA13]|nr:MAG: tRNA (adenosine(37)-N6)-threonylcarbamoyltransferase complex ATPase subunit type 1 TsaE [Blastocatellia bacterium AA13]
MNDSPPDSDPSLTDRLGEEIITSAPGDTFEVGRQIGEQLRETSVLLLSGELGAGKTLFAKGLAAGLGIDPSEITSPTFTLINIREGRMRLYHIDLYRLDVAASFDLGLDEILDQEHAVIVIEWAERLNYVPPAAFKIDIEVLSETHRSIRITRPWRLVH